MILLYANDIVLMEKSPYDLGRQLITLKDFCSSMGKKEVMIIKSKRITYDTFVYEKNSFEEFPSYKYLGIDIHHKSQLEL